MLIGQFATRDADSATQVLSSGRVNVWFAMLDRPGMGVHRLARLLDPSERGKAESFRFERDRNRFVAAKAVLRTILGTCLGENPRRIAFLRGRYGKPVLPEEFGGGRVRFNMSHSHGAALVAVALGREVGVDLESVRPLDNPDDLSESAFSPAERDAIRSLPEGARLRAFFDCWTRKEAFIKAVGAGLSFPLKGFDVSIAPGAGPRAIVVRENPRDGVRWMLHSMDIHPAYAAALVAEGADWQLEFRHWNVEVQDV